MVDTICFNCGVRINDPTTQVVHSDRTYCCANCSAARESQGGGSDPQGVQHGGDLTCAHCGSAIVDESTMEERGDQAFCCRNCLTAMEGAASAR